MKYDDVNPILTLFTDIKYTHTQKNHSHYNNDMLCIRSTVNISLQYTVKILAYLSVN